MGKRWLICLAIIACASVGAAHAYEFWGVTVGTQTYSGNSQLTFDGLTGSDIGYTVGGYEYTRVDSQWMGPFTAPDPGSAFLISRKCDAQGLFFKADADAAKFVVITTSLQTGVTAPEVGSGTRRYGPGDLKLDCNGNTYGIGLRLSDLTWAVDPATTNPEFRIINPAGGYESIFARDAGTLGRVELNPQWARVGHSSLAQGSDKAHAFYVSGSGALVGEASVNFQPTGLVLGIAPVFSYEVTVPWSSIGLPSSPRTFTASWRPDCGNDILSLQYKDQLAMADFPEPTTWVALVSGLGAMVAMKRRK